MSRSCRPAASSWATDRPGRSSFLHAVALCFLLLVAGGCSDRQKRAWKPQSQSDNYRLALESEDGNVRRDAVVRIAESGYVDSHDGFLVLDTVARTDPIGQIRCVAIRAFRRYEDSRPGATLLVVLNARAGDGKSIPPDDDVRWEAASALLALESEQLLEENQRREALDVFLKLSETGSERNVRLVALEALGHFQERRVFSPLIAALREPDFGYAERAERALISLTGTTQSFDADAWEKWLASTADPFANAGQEPEVVRQEGPTWWDRQKRSWQRALKLGGRD